MTPQQLAYIERRRRQIRYWPLLAILLALAVCAFYGWLWLEMPLNVNPLLVIDQFQQKLLPDEQLVMLAARGSLAVAGCGLFILAILLMISLALRNEARLIRLLDEARAGSGPADGPATATADVAPGEGTDAPAAELSAPDPAPPAGHD